MRTAALVGGMLLLLGCGETPVACGDEEEPVSPMADSAPPGAEAEAEPTAADGTLDRQSVLGPFLAEHWRLPVPHQGEPPAAFAPLEASLRPQDCGACHPDQYAQWKGSLHAEAYSPGFAGQLIEGSLSAPASLRHCQTCHAPLSEQQPVAASGEPEPHYDADLRAEGIVCASCHVRAHVRYGPPRRAELPPLQEPVPHGGFEVRDEFRESRFCATCHQFWNDPGINGKPIENTYAEWLASPQAERGETCQSCHMPDRAHQWRGIHDADMVRSGVEVSLSAERDADAVEARLTLRSVAIGHAFPSYVTPRVFLAVSQVDADGGEIEGTRQELTIARQIDFRKSPWQEIADTRVLPGEAAELPYRAPVHARARAIVGTVTVDPDYHYRGVFESMRGRYEDPEARRMMEEAYRRTSASRYVLTEIRRELD